ncbi:hypothetical protein A1O1_01402 [Capronia coronata CBS 617.96]|uniref:Transmembrane protein n=1 Tax=Capronia coronata CBS 617.96 TaxID=1182541 RepID=W9Z3V9_9EURO|nr:uncharacterized protein A1O1_01402 [Capronia coronata CBS 617.96]EXJ96276.1 hypothetical protein A1O1_01402 [Capronia coronata CBS 617.96]
MTVTKGHKDVHWKAPTLMLLPTAAGLGLALGQHFFYHHLNGRATDGSETKYSQALNTGIGTAMAFLVRSQLVLAIGTAYAQLFWQRLRHKQVKFTEIDSLFSILTSVMDLLRWRIWVHHPLLAFVALLAWLLPLTAVVAPTALTTHWSERSRETYQMAKVPVPDFNRSSYGILGADMTNGYLSWRGSQYTLDRLTLATATGGEVLSAPAPAVNSSYTISFYGPSLHCQPPSSAFNQSFQTLITDLEQGKLLYQQILYAAWRPNDTDNLPWLETMLETGFDQGAGRNLIGPGDQTATVYFAFTGANAPTVVECTLTNSSYLVEITNSNGFQTQRVRKAQPLGNITTISGYQSHTDDALRQILAYETMLASFFDILLGSIVHPRSADSNIWSTDTTQVMATTLGLSDELYPILTESDAMTDYETPTEPDVVPSGKSFARSAEELFQNITLSLMAFERYRTNFTDIQHEHPLTNVTIYSPYIVYDYAPRNLIIAYASAVGVALVIVVIGSLVLFTSGKSFSNTFTTVMRTTNNPHVEGIVTQDDKDGRDPLAKHIAQSTFDLRHDNIATEKAASDSTPSQPASLISEKVVKPSIVRAKSLPARALMNTAVTDAGPLPISPPTAENSRPNHGEGTVHEGPDGGRSGEGPSHRSTW